MKEKSINIIFVKRTITVLILSVIAHFVANAASVSAQVEKQMRNIVGASVPSSMSIGEVKVKSVETSAEEKRVTIDLNENYSYVPFTEESIKDLAGKIKSILPREFAKWEVKFTIEGNEIENYLPMFGSEIHSKHHKRFITRVEPEFTCKKGLEGNIIALWQSHGWYFEPKLNRWEWQRARIFQTVEDLYTQSFVMPYLMPMLENAGAYVMSPRERDTNAFEVIVDADGGLAQSGYSEIKRGEKWQSGEGAGFAYLQSRYEGFANPFGEGTYRIARATKNKKKLSTARWDAEVPESGEYAVYISYKSLPASATDAVYYVNSMSGRSTFIVNQQMGGGTWIYLGHYPLKKGLNDGVVELLNYSESGKDAVVTADAVKIGGGMGNIARKVEALAENVKSSEEKEAISIEKPDVDFRYQVSGHPRYTEAARYFLQWAGVPDSIYSPSQGVNDYTDDYRCRGNWVNYLAGGSDVLPGYGGLGIPVDLSFAFHSDAGTTMNDDIIGTLGIYYSNNFGKYANGTPRIVSRTFTDMVMTNIVNDVRRQYEPKWTRRGMWDKSYFEARVPEVPTMLLELLSHQNFADMKYGLDPNFRFTVSRAIYKGMLEFIAKRDGRKFVVQPLPVNSMALTEAGKGKFLLTWKATTDTLCDRAEATHFVVYERVGSGAFKRQAVVSEPRYEVILTDNEIHSFKVEAMNEGGRSFPSEILACGVAKDTKGTVMVVNGFTRISAPDWFDAGRIAGFYDEKDHGVPYIKDISFIGSQFEFRRDIPWMDDDAAGFGASRSNYETQVIAGNTFDYPAVHGAAIMNAGYSFVSSSVAAVNSGRVTLSDYPAVDLILGKQKETINGRGAYPNRYKAFPAELRKAIEAYCHGGGNIFVSGAYVASDIWDNKNLSDEEGKRFAKEVLGYQWRVGQASLTGEVYSVPSVYRQLDIVDRSWKFANELNDKHYCVESPDALFPADPLTGATILRYKENNLPAGVATAKSYRTCVIGFPFETIEDESGRNELMRGILEFFAARKNDNKK